MEQVIYRAMEREDIDRAAAGLVAVFGDRPANQKTLAGYFDEQERGLRTVLIAECGGEVAGFVTLARSAKTGPFKGKDIPAIYDLRVFEIFQEQGVGTELMNRAEALAAETSDTVCLGVGVSWVSGAALRLFVKRGYVPDISGVWCGRSPVRSNMTLEDAGCLTLYMSKELR
jgi:GNAT superfamily N-acetyltransferase